MVVFHLPSDGFNAYQIEQLSKQFAKVAHENPKRAKKFLNQQGTKLKTATKRVARKKVKKRTGGYLDSIKRGKYYTYGGKETHSIRVYSGAKHAHLIENGHVIVSHGVEVGFREGKHVFADAKREFEPKFVDAIEDFLDEVATEVEK